MTNEIRPYALPAGAGWTYGLGSLGVDFTVKAGERGPGRRLAFFEYTTRAGEEPGDHTHGTEDEIFYVLQGALTFRCGDDNFDVSDGGFVFLPRGIEHGYRIRSADDVRLLVVTSPAHEAAVRGWDGFVAGFETPEFLRSTP